MQLKAANSNRPQRGYRLQDTEHIHAGMMHLADLISAVHTYAQAGDEYIQQYCCKHFNTCTSCMVAHEIRLFSMHMIQFARGLEHSKAANRPQRGYMLQDTYEVLSVLSIHFTVTQCLLNLLRGSTGTAKARQAYIAKPKPASYANSSRAKVTLSGCLSSNESLSISSNRYQHEGTLSCRWLQSASYEAAAAAYLSGVSSGSICSGPSASA